MNRPDPSHPSSGALKFYELNAQSYAERTWGMDMEPVRQRFAAHLKPGSRLLDAGCGSGRDALAFKNAGFAVSAFDGSANLAAIATTRTGLPVRHLRFHELVEEGAYEAVWACASLVHLADAELKVALARLRDALTVSGMLYTCFKEGNGMRTDEAGRPFNDFTKDRLRLMLRDAGFTIRETWRTAQRGSEQGWWLNAVVAKLY